MKVESVLVVYKRTAYEMYCEEERDPRLLQLISQGHFTVQELHKAHQEHRETMERVGAALDQLKVSNRFVRRADLRDTIVHDLVLTVGGDGTFLATTHHVREKPMLGINSSPSNSVGSFCGANGKSVKGLLQEVLKGKLKPVLLNRIGLLLNGNAIIEPVLNEALVCSQNPAMTARYVLELGKKRDHQKSSGIYLGPAAGSTAVIRSAGGAVLPLSSKKVQFVVREPYRQPGVKLGLVKGFVPPKSGVRIYSKMRNGMIYVDGAHVRYRFDFGDELQVIPEYAPLPVLGLGRRKRK